MAQQFEFTGFSGLRQFGIAAATPLLAAAAGTPVGGSGGRLIHDPPDRSRAPSTFGAAAETTVDLACRPYAALGRDGSHLMIRNDVARTHDHGDAPQ